MLTSWIMVLLLAWTSWDPSNVNCWYFFICISGWCSTPTLLLICSSLSTTQIYSDFKLDGCVHHPSHHPKPWPSGPSTPRKHGMMTACATNKQTWGDYPLNDPQLTAVFLKIALNILNVSKLFWNQFRTWIILRLVLGCSLPKTRTCIDIRILYTVNI